MQGSIVILLVLIISTISVECISPSSSHRDELEGGGDDVADSSHHTDSSIVASRQHHYVRIGEEVKNIVSNPRVLGLFNGKAKPENPSKAPTTPSPTSNPACVTLKTYDTIDKDIEKISKGITDVKSRGRFLGGIVRLVAHDFMDYDRNNSTHPFGPDGCFNATHPANRGIASIIWCTTCELTLLYEQKYSHMSKADFWVAAANAVIRQTSLGALDLRSTYKWGRKDAASCPGAGSRIPNAAGCGSVEGVFLTRMGLTWKDAVVLIGAHTLGRGNSEFSGHDGTWKDTEEDAQVFDSQFFHEVLGNSWEPRNAGLRNQDWTIVTDPNTRLMLNTDLCLVYDIDNTMPCCTGDSCVDVIAAATRCPVLSSSHARYEAYETVQQMLGGNEPNTNINNAPFYSLFPESWNKATTIGQSNLSPLKDTC